MLAAVTVSDKQSPLDFFPLLVEYREKTYAAGKIPGGFIKREGRPSEREIRYETLVQRLLRHADAGERRIVCLSAILPSGDELLDRLPGAVCARDLEIVEVDSAFDAVAAVLVESPALGEPEHRVR